MTPHGGNSLSKTRGCWGWRDDDDQDAARINGRPSGRVRPLNSHRRTYGAGDIIGLEIDMDAGSIQLHRALNPCLLSSYGRTVSHRW